MPAEVGIRELAEYAGADEAADAVFLDGLPRIGPQGREDTESG